MDQLHSERVASESRTSEHVQRRVFWRRATYLQSTAEDYLRFAQMLANGGILNREQAAQSGDRAVDGEQSGRRDAPLLAGQDRGSSSAPWRTQSLSGRVSRREASAWAGTFGTLFWIDPKEKLVMILMIQSAPANNALRREFENSVMQSIVR